MSLTWAETLAVSAAKPTFVASFNVPEHFSIDARGYGNVRGRVYHLTVRWYGGSSEVSVSGHLYKFKKDGTAGKAASQIAHESLKFSELPDEIQGAVRVAYTEWATDVPEELPA